MAEDVHELSAGYALDVLDDGERRRFEAHLAECERCRDEVDSFRTAATALAFADPAPPPPPPAELRDRILTAARAERPNVVPLHPRRPWALAAASSLAAVASVAAVAFAVWAVTASHSLSRERAALRVIGDPAARRLPVAGARGALFVAPSGAAALAVDLATPPKGKTYEAWVIDPQPQRAAVFSGGTTKLQLPVHRGARVAVTIERAGGVDKPTSNPVLIVRA
jgi:anti-sigma-K factor RskA